MQYAPSDSIDAQLNAFTFILLYVEQSSVFYTVNVTHKLLSNLQTSPDTFIQAFLLLLASSHVKSFDILLVINTHFPFLNPHG